MRGLLFFLLLVICKAVCAAPAYSVWGDFKYAPGFSHFDYVNPQAPKGGELRVVAGSRVSTLDKYNPYTLKGSAPSFLGDLLFESLLTGSMDEVGAGYGLLAEDVEVAPDGLSAAFRLRRQARFHNGDPVTAADVKYSYDTLVSKYAAPSYATLLADVTGCEVVDQRTVRFRFKRRDRQLPLVVNLVRKFADRVAVMESGHLVEEGAVASVFADPRHPYTRKLIDSRPVRDVHDGVPGGAASVMQAKALRVGYPVPVAGMRGWFRKGEFVAVQGADFSIPPGRTLGVVGESGSGKSSLALAALGLIPHGGELDVVGRRWGPGAAGNKAIRRLVQVVFQDPFSSLSPRMTVEEIVGEGLLVHEPGLTAPQRQQRVAAALHEVGMEEEQFPGLLARYPHEFSGGQRQRLAIARALIVQPQLLILDEPTSALDVTIQKQILKLLQRLQREKGLAYLLITHDVDVIRAMAHEVLVMKDGRILESGPVRAVLDAPRDDYTRTLVAAAS